MGVTIFAHGRNSLFSHPVHEGHVCLLRLRVIVRHGRTREQVLDVHLVHSVQLQLRSQFWQTSDVQSTMNFTQVIDARLPR